MRSRDQFNTEPSGDLSPCFELGRLESDFSLGPKMVMIYSVISCFQFLQVTLKCFFLPSAKWEHWLEISEGFKDTCFPQLYIDIFLS